MRGRCCWCVPVGWTRPCGLVEVCLVPWPAASCPLPASSRCCKPGHHGDGAQSHVCRCPRCPRDGRGVLQRRDKVSAVGAGEAAGRCGPKLSALPAPLCRTSSLSTARSFGATRSTTPSSSCSGCSTAYMRTWAPLPPRSRPTSPRRWVTLTEVAVHLGQEDNVHTECGTGEAKTS